MDEAILVGFESIEQVGEDLLITAYPTTKSSRNKRVNLCKTTEKVMGDENERV